MADNHDYVALDWVKGEIDSTLTQAQIALEDYVKHPEDSTRLRFCLNYIHQVHGTLQMVEFYGAALLAEEMEHLTQALLGGGLARPNEAIEVLMRAILQLPNYLSRLQVSQSDLPVILLPILNDLRASRGADLLSDTSLFTPDLSIMHLPATTQHRSLLDKPNTVTQIRKLRQMFQFSLAGIVRESDMDANLGNLLKVCGRLQAICKSTSFAQLWRLGAAFTEAIRNGDIDLSSGTKNILRSLDINIKRLIEESADILDRPAPEDLAKHILYYIARSSSENPRLASIRKDYRLDIALPTDKTIDRERQKMSGPDKGAIESVVGALNEELARVKDQLDLYVRGDYKDINELGDLTPSLQQVANTMAVLGLGLPRKVIEDQIGVIEQLVSGSLNADDNVLMDIAGALLYVEATLSGYGEEQSSSESSSDDNFLMPKEQINSAHEAVIREARNGLEQAKTDIVEYIASHWDKSEIQGVPALLQTIRGGLQIIPLSRAAELLHACSSFISEQLLASEAAPDWQQLDTLADAITSIEYYLERLGEGSRENDMILEVAEQSLVQLGYPVGGEAARTAPLQAAVSQAQAQAPAASHEKETDQELIDDEIIEIFSEEAAEVLQTIHQHYPVFQAQPDDASALTELRRAYHTLKGSGRLVGATSIGELAWAVENMLNRVIEGSVSASLSMFELLESVNARLPDLIDAYQHGQAICDVSAYIDTADALAAARKQAREASKAEAARQAAEAEQNRATEAEPATSLSPADHSGNEQPMPADEFASDDMIDDEIIEIFVEEAAEVLENIHQYLPAYLTSFDNKEALLEVRRGFHTLKGSGRLVGANVVGELAWSVENMLNRVLDGTIAMHQRTGQLIEEVISLIPDLVEDFEKQQKPSHDVGRLMAAATAIANGEAAGAASRTGAAPAPDKAEPDLEQADSSELAVDPVLIDIFRAETESHLDSLERFIREAQSSATDLQITDDLSRAMHTLKGSANTAGIAPIAEVAIPVERFVKEARAKGICVDASMNAMLSEAVGFIRKGLEQIETTPQAAITGTSQFLISLDELSHKMLADKSTIQHIEGQSDPKLISLFLIEGVDILLDAERILNDWSENHSHTEEIAKLVDELTSLEQGAKTAGLSDVARLAGAMEALYETAVEIKPTDDDFYTVASRGHEALISMMDQVAAGLTTQSQAELIVEIKQLNEQLSASYQQQIPSTDAAEDSTKSAEEAPAKSTAEIARTAQADLDPELAEIFLEEARDIIHRSGEVLYGWSEDLQNTDCIAQLQRDLHTLKGGARMAGISALGDLAHQLESLFEGINAGAMQASQALVSVVNEAHDALANMIDAVARQQAVDPATELLSRLRQLTNEAKQGTSSSAKSTDQSSTADATKFQDLDTSHVENEVYELTALDQELVSLFLEEAEDLIYSTANNLQTWLEDIDNVAEVKDLQRALHTLKGGARLCEIKPIGDLAHELETLFEGIVEGRFKADKSLSSLLLQCHDRLAEMVEKVTENQPVPAGQDLILRIHHYCQHHAKGAVVENDALSSIAALAGKASEAELRDIFLDESREIMEAIADCLDLWKTNSDNILPAKELSRNLSILNSAAVIAKIDSISKLAGALAKRMDSIADGLHQVSDEMISVIEKSVKHIGQLLIQLDEQEQPAIPDELINELQRMGAGQLVERPELLLDIDVEILQVFVEEADELRNTLDKELSDWGRDQRNFIHAENLARTLHTLKGGARLANLGFIGDLAQEFESLVRTASEQGTLLNDELRGEMDPLFYRLKSELDKVNVFCEKLADNEQQASASRSAEAESDARHSQSPAQFQQPRTSASTSATAKPKPKAQPRQVPVESVRVSSPLLDELVNLAGETSITRGLLEQQISDFTYTLEEMQATIDRLREQLRRMDMETEAQILFSLEKEGVLEYEDFDPLEMDRYSSIQQLSRALSESTFDLTDLRETMLNKARDAETLLLQQSRINTELQEGLMKTRMIPFTSIVPRLRRIVRQISAELGKKVEFEVYNPEGELDRNVLERIVAPLEHMIRNAIGHGIEMPEDRIKAGKPAVGKIELSLAREGGDVVLVMSDDGAGIDIDAVRDKAATQGLLDSKTATSDHDVLQFIFHAGFSTAKKVTQVSGRGVGMDVVSSEIKQLSGRVSIDSKKGKGTRFVVHLPFTVSVNRALMVNTGEDYYAIPLNTIEGIVRVSTYELEEYYKPNAPLYEYAGQKYQLQYLGSLLKSGHYPKLQGQSLPLPVILVRGAGDQPLALQVDSLMGSREIVVKTLGTQFSKVKGVSGATILGDGNVVVILDLPAMLHSDFSATIASEEALGPEIPEADADSPTRVMVVDDSVTVRKVTSRLLERNGMEVLLAKDGVDAITLLQDNRPDVILLDIEMPRMDGFEVASLVRHDERLKDVPIIMITSRTGQKHRDRALALGVNEYLGKPFQESNLLATIARLVD